MTKWFGYKSYLRNPVFWLVVSLRFLAALYILINPLWGYVLTLVFDYFDSYFLAAKKNLVEMPWKDYLLWDKYLDLVGYVTMLIVGLRMGFPVLLILFLYRLIGQVLFFITQKEYLFVIFINFFQPVYIWLVAFKILNITPTYLWLLILTGMQITMEIFNHIYWPKRIKKGFPWYFKIFGSIREPNFN
jgi:hypothetical protein